MPIVVIGQKIPFPLQEATLTFQGPEGSFFSVSSSVSRLVTQPRRFLRHHLIISLLSDLRQHTHCHRSLLRGPGKLQRASGGDGDVPPTQTAPQSRGSCCTNASGTGPSLLATQELLHFPVPVVRAGWPSTAATAKGLQGKLLPTWLPAFRPLCHILPVPHPFRL